MCGRARLSSDISEIKVAFRIPPERPSPNLAASWNVAPTDPLPVVRYEATGHQPSLEVMRWGLVPFWAKDIKVGFANINAKAEGIETKPAFREAFRQRLARSAKCWKVRPTGRGDATRARSAVQQIEVAFVTMRDGGNPHTAAYYEAQLPKARAVLDRLASR
jgi:hypothetical protein